MIEWMNHHKAASMLYCAEAYLFSRLPVRWPSLIIA